MQFYGRKSVRRRRKVFVRCVEVLLRGKTVVSVGLATFGITLCLLASVIGVDDSYAGLAQVQACSTPDGVVAPADGWSASHVGTYAYHEDKCASRGGLAVALEHAVPHANENGAHWTYTAPTGTVITEIRGRRATQVDAGIAHGTPQYMLLTGDGARLENCAVPHRCSSRGNLSNPLAPENNVHFAGLSTRSLVFAVTCTGISGCPATKTIKAFATLYGATITLQQDAFPEVTNVHGALANDSKLIGNVALRFLAKSGGMGIYRLHITLDGNPMPSHILDDNGGKCRPVTGNPDDHTWNYNVPCKKSLSTAVNFDTTQWDNGRHQLVASIEDATGNRSTFLDRQVNVNNPQLNPNPGSPDIASLVVTPDPSWKDPNAVASEANTAKYSKPVDLSPFIHSQALRKPNGENACATAQLVAKFRRGLKHTVPYGKTAVLKGRLRCSTNGQPIRKAVVAAHTRVLRNSRTDRPTYVKTDDNGNFTFRVSKGPSREINLSYKPFSDLQSPVAKATAKLAVRTKVSLRIAPRSLRNGSATTWRGRVFGSRFPRNGVRVQVQFRHGKKWRIFGQARTDRKGRFTYKYTFRRTHNPRTYRFRAVVPVDVAGYPYAGGRSRIITVRVKP